MATCTPLSAAVTRTGDDSGECLAAFASRLFRTWTDASPIDQHPRQVLRQIDAQGMPASAAQEGAPGLVHQARQLRRLRRHRQRAGLDAALVQQVRDEAPHVIGLSIDDPEELEHFGGIRGRSGAEHGGGGALDGDQGSPQFVAHQAQELGPLPLGLLQGREVLHRGHVRFDLAVRCPDGSGVHQRGDAPSARDRERELLGAHCLSDADLLHDRELREHDFPPIRAPCGQTFQQSLQGGARRTKRLRDPPRLPVDPNESAGSGVEDDDAHRRGFDQGLEVGAGPLLVAMGPRVGDGDGGLRREQHQDLLVGARELASGLLLGEKEVPDVDAPVEHRGTLEGLRADQVRREAEGSDIGGEVRDTQRGLEVPEVLEEPRPLRPVRQCLAFLRREARGDEVFGLSRLVDGRDRPVAGAGQGAGAVDGLLEDGIEIEARADAEDGGAQPGNAFLERFDLLS